MQALNNKNILKHRELYCRDIENVENYEKAKADNFVGWCCHHRLETHTSDGERRAVELTRNELKALGIYFNRPSSELIFLTNEEHNTLHKKDKHWFNNGKINIRSKDCPYGFVPGQLRCIK